MAKRQPDKNKNQAAAGAALAETPEREDEARRDSYRVKLEIFEGPLDLLLYLIRKDEIDIYDIPIAHITEQYLSYLGLMQELDIAVAGDFLVMASTLIYIKSKLLLPPDPKAEGEEDLTEDPRAELVERLLEYQKYKSASQMFYSRGEIEAACYTRGALETDSGNPEVSATVFDLLRVFREILKRAEDKVELEIARDEVTIAEKLTQIYDLLDRYEQINVRELFEMSRSKRELILTFLAFLELVKEWKIHLVQRELFGDIYARKRNEVPAEVEQGPVDRDAEAQGAEPAATAAAEQGADQTSTNSGETEKTDESGAPGVEHAAEALPVDAPGDDEKGAAAPEETYE
jgi:segregation and condensation protein A